MEQTDGRARAVIEGVRPAVDGGRFPIKRIVGDTVTVHADVFCDGHDLPVAVLQFRHSSETEWREAPMQPLGNDRWYGQFQVERLGRYHYRMVAWVDHFLTWRQELARRTDPADITLALQAGARLMHETAARAGGDTGIALAARANKLLDDTDATERCRLALDESVVDLMKRHSERRFAARTDPLDVVVDRARARFSAWYELFPRSCDGAQHGRFADCEQRLSYIAHMGFDVVYLPPVHPIGRTKRKGRNNILTAAADDPGSPWAIGAPEGGHKAVHPHLGTLDDFRRFIGAAQNSGLEVALDLAFQCSPDHPYVVEHPEWFRRRPDGSVQFAENPPKKYEDIYPFDFETENWRGLWDELKDVVMFWIAQGVRIFRVDNPHTKPFAFWEWLICETKRDHPEVLFLSEAFSRPKIMHRLAKLGFTQSYTYFTWRNTKEELTGYLSELTRAEIADYFQPNFWPNTPDILPEYLQFGGRPAFMARLALAATLSGNYGVYGPAYELFEASARVPGSEDYLDSEKFQIRQWDLHRHDSLREFMARINRIRRENAALHGNRRLQFLTVDNDQIIAYSKATDDLDNIVVVAVSLDPYYTQSGWLELPLATLGLDPHRGYQMHDLLTDARYLWHGERNYVQLNPQQTPAHIFRVRRHVRTERDFEYFM